MSFPTIHDEISPQEWEWVRDIINELDRAEKRENYARLLFQWDLSVKQFRKVELKRMIMGDPTETDIRFHSICLHSLLAVGNFLVLHARMFSPDELGQIGVTSSDIDACVNELEQSYREWHHGFSKREVEAVQKQLLSG